MLGGTIEGQNQRTLELIEHLLKTGQLTLHGLLYLLHDTQSTTELAKIAELSSKRPLVIQTSLAEHDYIIAYNAFYAGVVYADTVPKGTGGTSSAANEYAQRIKEGK